MILRVEYKESSVIPYDVPVLQMADRVVYWETPAAWSVPLQCLAEKLSMLHSTFSRWFRQSQGRIS